MAEQLQFRLPAPSEYLQERDGNIYFNTTRVTLASVVLLWRQGMSAEAIQADFPSVSLASVYGAIAYYIAYYLDHQSNIDPYLDTLEERQRTLEADAEAKHQGLYAQMRQQMRQQMTEARRELATHHDKSAAPLNEHENHVVESPTA